MERPIANLMVVYFSKFCIREKPAKDVPTVPVTVRVSGRIDYSKATFFRRWTSNMERKDLEKMLGEFMPVHVHPPTPPFNPFLDCLKNTRCTGLKPTVYTPEAPIPPVCGYSTIYTTHVHYYTASALTRFAKGHKPFFFCI